MLADSRATAYQKIKGGNNEKKRQKTICAATALCWNGNNAYVSKPLPDL